MSKGNKIIQVRMDPQLLAQIDAAIRSANQLRFAAPYDVSEWIRSCVVARLAHLRRSRSRRAKYPSPTTMPLPSDESPSQREAPEDGDVHG